MSLPPIIATRPEGAFLIHLITFNGSPFMDHWAYWISKDSETDIGVVIHATGDVRNGFQLEIKRSHDLCAPGNKPTTKTPLQWIDRKYIDEGKMFNHGIPIMDYSPVSGIEKSLFQVKAPGKTLNSVEHMGVAASRVGKKIIQKNCQTWVVESADQLVAEGIFTQQVSDYLRSKKQ